MATAEQLHTDTLEWLVHETHTVYSLPIFYDQLTEAINHPCSSIADIATIITQDQGLTARLLKLANSPLFGYFSEIDSINKAIMIIGTRQLRDLALAVSVMEVFAGIPEDLINMKSFWRHSIACGIIARALAVYRREPNAERFFAAGILHDVGQLVMCTTIPETVSDLLLASKKLKTLHFKTELARLGFTHVTVGGNLFRKWGIPASIAEPVSYHHTPARAGFYPLEAAVIHMADIICHALGFGLNGEEFIPALSQVAWERLDMQAGALSTIVRQAEPQLEETFAILGGGAL
jgi:HD-like signal output (HDOD) protein